MSSSPPIEVMPADLASSLTVGLRWSSATLTRLRKGSISWLSAGTDEWVKIVAFSGSSPAAMLSRSRLRTLPAMSPATSRSVITW